MYKRLSTLIFLLVCTVGVARAQLAGTTLQLSGQASIPLGDFKSEVSPGYGANLRIMQKFESLKGYLSLEGGYSNFKLKFPPLGVKSHIYTIPVLLGYRYQFGGFSLEPQAGVSFNQAVASTRSNRVTANFTGFSWAAGVNYNIPQFTHIEFGIRYQQTVPFKDGLNEGFLGLRLGYNLGLR